MEGVYHHELLERHAVKIRLWCLYRERLSHGIPECHLTKDERPHLCRIPRESKQAVQYIEIVQVHPLHDICRDSKVMGIELCIFLQIARFADDGQKLPFRQFLP